jgi:hypothetical protein
MITDPMSVPSQAFSFSGSWPQASLTGIQSKGFNILTSSGRKTVRSLSGSDLSSLGLSKFLATISHEPTSDGKLRSVLRLDVGKKDAAGVEHVASCYLNIIQEQAVTAEHTAALAYAFGTMCVLLVGGSGAGASGTNGVATEFLNGEP